MSYTESITTKLLATNCLCCGRDLVDAVSVEAGIGPVCRDGAYPLGITEEGRVKANSLVYRGAVAAQNGNIPLVMQVAEELRGIGFERLADKVSLRFDLGVAKAEKSADIVIEVKGSNFVVKTPFRRGDKEAFMNAWRSIPGRRYVWADKLNTVPVSQRTALWGLLAKFFPGKWGKGPKGAFRIPKK